MGPIQSKLSNLLIIVGSQGVALIGGLVLGSPCGSPKVKTRKSFLFTSPKSSLVLKIKNTWLIVLSHCKHERFPV